MTHEPSASEEVIDLVSKLQNKIYKLEKEAAQARMCRATLYCNFVMKDNYGAQIPKDVADKYSTHQLMCEILLKLTTKE